MHARILIIEDDAEIAELIRVYLEKEGMEARIASDAESGLELLQLGGTDLVLLDLNLPGMDGFEFLQTVRKTNAVPVLIVSARDEDSDLILGLGLGADEFVTKPFSPKVLVARVRALLRRVQTPATGESERIVAFGEYRLNVDDLTLKKNGERMVLPSREMDLLAFLARRAGEVFSPAQLYEAVWGNAYGDITTVAVHVQRLRKKIEADPKDPVFLKTLSGRGYCFATEDGKG